MRVSRDHVGGKVTKDNSTYILQDNNFLDNLTLSKTTLKPKQCTNGHSHDDLEEIYFFMKGSGRMQLDEEIFEVKKGDIVLIPSGKFHKVYNDMHIPMEFVCVFEKYDRDSDIAKYNKLDQNEDVPFAD